MSIIATEVAAVRELLDALAARGYDPDEDAPEYLRADLVFSGTGCVRVIIADAEVTVIAFDLYMIEMWSARFSNFTPAPAILAAMDAAESQAAKLT